MTNNEDRVAEIKQLLESCNDEQKYEIFQLLRKDFSIHPIEKQLNANAETILEAISRASDLTIRGIRGVLAEAAFEIDIVNKLQNWRNLTVVGNYAYDFLLNDGIGDVRIQVKMQRQKDRRPMMANEGYKYLPSTMYVVETQRTRGGQRAGKATRPYRFGEFDILAVSMQPSTLSWKDFMFTVQKWLLPNSEDSSQLLKFQPVSKTSNDIWTSSFHECVMWLRSGVDKQII